MYDERLFFGMGPHSMIRIPFMGSDSEPVYWKIGDYIPLSSTMKGTPNGFMGATWFPGGLTPNGPLVTIAALFLNKDSYTGDKISEDTDTTLDTALANTGALYDMFAPPILSSRVAGQSVDYLYGNKTVSGREKTSAFALRAFGLKFYDPTVTDELIYRGFEESAIKREYGKAIAKYKREEMRSGAPDYEALSEKLLELQSNMEDDIAELNKRD